jgi:hypothetical protein
VRARQRSRQQRLDDLVLEVRTLALAQRAPLGGLDLEDLLVEHLADRGRRQQALLRARAHEVEIRGTVHQVRRAGSHRRDPARALRVESAAGHEAGPEQSLAQLVDGAG